MDPALYISMTGAKRNLVEQGVYSNNLANVNTTGFQGDLYQAESLYVNRGQYPVQVYTASTPSAISFEPERGVLRPGEIQTVTLMEEISFCKKAYSK